MSRTASIAISLLSIATSLLSVATSLLFGVAVAAGSFAAAGCGARVAPVSARAPAAPLAPAGVDGFIRAGWEQAGVTPAAVTSDAEYLRRVTLDLIGRVPTVAEARAFLDDPTASATRRAALVDRLLASPAYAEHWADVYADLLLGREARLRGPLAQGGAARAWLVTALRENRGWDRITTELLTATGELGDNGAVAYVAAHAGKGGDAAAAAGATARVFLGLSIQCAQCHDHPYDQRYRQADFTAFTAFFGEVRARRSKPEEGGRPTVRVVDQPLPAAATGGGPRAERQRARAAARAKAKGRELPAWAFVAPRFLGRDVVVNQGESRRQALARAVVGSDLFAKAAVNRVWAYFLGGGLVEPWDDLGAEDDPEHPASLVRLAADFRASGHDLRALARAIVLSDAYARSSSAAPAASVAAPTGTADAADAAARAEGLFARARVRPLSADQIFRSLLVATGVEQAGRGRFRAAVQKGKERALREYLFVFPDDEMAEVGAFTGSVAQALLLWNGEVTNLGASAVEGSVLGDALRASPDPSLRLETLFLAAYARRPEAGERTALLATIAGRGGGDEAWEDVFFALLTSTEFLTNH